MAGSRSMAPVSGWIFGEIDNDAMFERFPSALAVDRSDVYGLAVRRQRFRGLRLGHGSEEVMLASSDGIHWQTFETPRGAWGRTARGRARRLAHGRKRR